MNIIKKQIKNLLLISTLVVGIIIGTQIMAFASFKLTNVPEYEKPDFPKNEMGLTYGSAAFVDFDDMPDLIRALGTNGKEGYIYAVDWNGDEPNTIEEVVIYMDNIRNLNEKGIFVRVIPLYAVDGVTVIGEYEISVDINNFRTEPLEKYN